MMRLSNLSFTFILSLAALLLLAWRIAATPTTQQVALHVDCADVTLCYATPQAAIDAAAPGDEIRVALVLR